MATILVIGEQAHGHLKKATLSALTAAQQLAQKNGGQIQGLLIGAGAAQAAQELSGYLGTVHSVEGSIMGVWNSTVAEDGLLFDLRIDLSIDGNPAHDVHSNVVTVLIDNVAPQALLDRPSPRYPEVTSCSPG